jgi:hypothetical protein
MKLQSENLKGGEHPKDESIPATILNWILKKEDART